MNILMSYHYYRDVDLDVLVSRFPRKPRIFADSGAFSAKSVGADVTVEGYAEWLKRWAHLFEVYVNLDVIGDPVATLENQRKLEALGVNPIPVFHTGSDWGYLEDYCKEYPYVALGGMVKAGSPRHVLRWCVKAFQVARPHGTMFHGFGQTILSVIKDLPWYSVDSSSWGSGHRYGTVVLWDDRSAKFVRIKLGDREQVYRHARLIREHGGDPAVLAAPGAGLKEGKDRDAYLRERTMVIGVSVVAWVRLEAWLRKRHGPLRLREGAKVGPTVYLADAETYKDDPDLGRAAHMMGPRVYLAEGSGEHLVTAGRFVDDQAV